MINNLTLVGRLAKDCDLRYTASGQAVASFTLAVNRNFTNQQGQREADFINCVIWKKQAENLANYARKGSLIGITGRIQTRSYDNQQGQKVYVTEVVADNFQLLESKSSNESRNGYQNAQNNAGATRNSFEGNYASNSQNGSQGSFRANSDPFGSNSIDIDDSDLPF